MTDTNRELLKLIERDPATTPTERKALHCLHRGDLAAYITAAPDRVLKRAEAAARFSCGLRSIDRWSKIGLLPRVRLPGFSRATGYRESDISRLIAGNPAK
jgi:hypothetical protein